MYKERIGFLDFLRGFALFGILAVNLPYFAKPMYLVGSIRENNNIWDLAATWIVTYFFEFKFYLLFSYLFGIGFSLQMDADSDSDSDSDSKTRIRYFRRIFGLFILGILHSVFLFLGDILFTYAILGAGLWFLRNKTPGWLFKFSLYCLVLAAIFRGGLVFAEDFYKSKLASELPLLLEESRKAYLGGFLENAKQRAIDTFLSFPILVIYQWPSVFAMFSLGLASGKLELFSNWEKTKQILSKYFPWVLPFALFGNLLYVASSRHLFPENIDKIWKLCFVFLEVFSAPALSFCYVYWLSLFYRSRWSEGDKPWFMIMGKYSLTNYLGESLVCAWIFCGWGLGKFDTFGNYVLLLLTPSIWLFWGLFSRIWNRFFSFGPMEWILRSWTYWKWMER